MHLESTVLCHLCLLFCLVSSLAWLYLVSIVSSSSTLGFLNMGEIIFVNKWEYLWTWFLAFFFKRITKPFPCKLVWRLKHPYYADYYQASLRNVKELLEREYLIKSSDVWFRISKESKVLGKFTFSQSLTRYYTNCYGQVGIKMFPLLLSFVCYAIL